MLDSERVLGWVRTMIAYVIWIVVLLVIWRVVLSLDSVQMSGFALEPFRSEIYFGGLPWILFIDIAFFTLLMITVVGFGTRLKREISRVPSRFSRLGNIAQLGGILGAIIIGYYAYDDLIYPPLYYQDVTWAYNLLLWVLVIGTSAAIVFELLSAVILAKREPKPAVSLSGQRNTSRETPAATSDAIAATDDGRCPSCGKELPMTALFCSRCGTRVSQQQGSE